MTVLPTGEGTLVLHRSTPIHKAHADFDQPHLELQALDAGIAVHNRISGAIGFLPGTNESTDAAFDGETRVSTIGDQALDDLERAGLFNRIRHPFPLPVTFAKSHRYVSQVYQFGARTVELQCPIPEILEALQATLGPLLKQPSVEQDGDVISLQFHGDGFGVFANGKPVFGQCDFAYARHFVMREIAISLAGRKEVSATFHAGAAGTSDRAFIFAADSGSGKSTLTAALCANGFVYHNDDQVALVGGEGRISSFPTRIGLKQGSWSVVEMDAYNIDAIEPTFLGEGYAKLVLPEIVGEPEIRPEIAAFVFPAFSTDGPFELTRISGLEAMQRLITCGARLAGRYPTIRPLAQTMAKVPAYALGYSNTVQAMDAVSDLLARS
ncbi:MAG: hypothetical protein AAGA76_16440 [Pseudomonadota bacterium]